MSLQRLLWTTGRFNVGRGAPTFWYVPLLRRVVAASPARYEDLVKVTIATAEGPRPLDVSANATRRRSRCGGGDEDTSVPCLWLRTNSPLKIVGRRPRGLFSPNALRHQCACALL